MAEQEASTTDFNRGKMLPNPELIKWASKLKKTEAPTQRNPFVTAKFPKLPGVVSKVGGPLLGATLVTAYTSIMKAQLRGYWAIPLASGALTLLLPSSSLSAGIGGAMFYDILSSTVSKVLPMARQWIPSDSLSKV